MSDTARTQAFEPDFGDAYLIALILTIVDVAMGVVVYHGINMLPGPGILVVIAALIVWACFRIVKANSFIDYCLSVPYMGEDSNLPTLIWTVPPFVFVWGTIVARDISCLGVQHAPIIFAIQFGVQTMGVYLYLRPLPTNP